MAHEAPQRRYQSLLPAAILSGAAVTKQGFGLIQNADYSTGALGKVIGVSLQLLNQNDYGYVKTSGWIPASKFSTANFKEAVLPGDNSRVWLYTNGQWSVSPPDELSGFQQVVAGLWDDGGLLLQPGFLGIA